jgi:extracellular factor (EF) 3-hydroxypalmitic acid methyl ester biosynthesis protein
MKKEERATPKNKIQEPSLIASPMPDPVHDRRSSLRTKIETTPLSKEKRTKIAKTLQEQNRRVGNDRREKIRKSAGEREKRHEARKIPDALHPEWVEIPLPFQKGARIVKEVIELSENGLSFKMAREEGFLLPGTIIKHLVIYHKGKQTEKPSAEIMYATPLQENGDFKIGVKLTSDPRKRSALGRKSFTHALRSVRHNLSNLMPQQKTIHFPDHNGLHCSGVLKNISPYGLAFEVDKGNYTEDLFLRLSDTIDPFEVQVCGKMIYRGKVTIATLRSDQGKTIVGVSLGEACEKIHDLIRQKGEDRANEIPFFLKLEKIDTSFKALVADLRYFLETVEKTLTEEEQKVFQEGAIHRNQIERALLTRFEAFAYNYLDQCLIKLNEQVSHYEEERHEYHRDYFQKQLISLICKSPFVRRAYSKPLGYAGDYEMMDMIYRDPYEGDTLFAKLLNKYFSHHIEPSKAVQNRVPFLLQKIEQVAAKERHEGKRSRILSLACGPANEAIMLIRNKQASHNIELTLIDIEPEALYCTQERILEEKKINKSNIKINVYYFPLKQLLTDMGKNLYLQDQDFIYCLGLFDYLSDDLCKKAIRGFYQKLCQDGMLIIGNFDPCNAFKACMEYCMEWHLIHRTQTDMVRLAREAVGTVPNVACLADPTGVNNFLVVQR